MSKSTEVLRICKEKGIRMIDFKMTDLNGRWRDVYKRQVWSCVYPKR